MTVFPQTPAPAAALSVAGADRCDTVVLDTGFVHGCHDTLHAPPLRYVGHRGVSAASQGIDAETQWVSSCWSLLCKCRGGVTKVA